MNKALLTTLVAAAVGGWGLFIAEKVQQPAETAAESTQAEADSGSAGIGESGAVVGTSEGERTGLAGELAWKERYLALQQQKEALEKQLTVAGTTLEELQSQLEVLTATGGEIESMLQDDATGAESARLLRRQQEELQVSRNITDGLRKGLTNVLANLSGLEEKVSLISGEKEQAARALVELQTTLQSELGEKEAQVKKLRNQTALIQLESDLLYEAGASELKWQGESSLDKIAALLAKYPDYTVSLEGHTDNRRLRDSLKGKYPSNWELSAARAAAAARYLAWRGIDPSRLRVVGYGPFHPRADNQTTEGRTANRRLEILLQPKRDPTTRIDRLSVDLSVDEEKPAAQAKTE
ncbi:MAG: OmpA family protein [Pseudomonadota bacterium]|nr:OmpA family protein [Pseudomonadota bacterium]